MNANPMKDHLLIKSFIHNLLDKRTGPYKNLKAANSLCREAIEKGLSHNKDIKNLINQNNNEYVKEIIVNYMLLKMHCHALLWEIDDHNPQHEEDQRENNCLF
jgi:hypothetical protein